MTPSILQQLREADYEVSRGDYVVLERTFLRGFITERIITFSDVIITRIKDANDAATFAKSKRNSSKRYAVQDHGRQGKDERPSCEEQRDEF